MGLPHVSAGNFVEELATDSLSTFLKSPPGFSNICSCDLSGMHGGNAGNPIAVDLPPPLLADFCRKADFEFLEGLECSNVHTGGTAEEQRLNVGCSERNGWLPGKGGRNIHEPASRTVGFKPKPSKASSNVLEDSCGTYLSTLPSITSNDRENGGSLARKRMLSPSNRLLLRMNSLVILLTLEAIYLGMTVNTDLLVIVILGCKRRRKLILATPVPEILQFGLL